MADLARVYSGAYERYVLRDLTYVTGGCIVALSAALYLGGFARTKEAVAYVTGNACLALLSVMASYLVGVLVKETVENVFRFVQLVLEKLARRLWGDKAGSFVDDHVFLIRTRPPAKVGELDNYALVLDSLEKQRGPQVLARLERAVFLFHLGAIIASSGFVSVLLLAFSRIPNKDFVLALGLAFVVAAASENYVKFRH